MMQDQQKNLGFIVIAAALGVGLVLTGCGRHGARGPQEMGPPEVGFFTVSEQPLELTTVLPGRTSAFREAQIRPQVNGLILERVFEEGADVKVGDRLYQIDPAPYQAAVDQAKAAVAMAEASLPALRSREARMKDLVTTRAVGQQDYDDALAALKQAEAQRESGKAALASAQINLSYTPIHAPVAGRIGRSAVTEGALVTAYQPIPLATIRQLDPIYLDVTQSTAELLRLKRRLADGRLSEEGTDLATVTILQEDGIPYPHEGTLAFRDVTVDPSTASVVLRIVVPNPENALLPGMFLRAILKEGVRRQAILVPQQSVNRNPKGQPFSWVVTADGKADVRMLEVDQAIGNQWHITSGLAAGDRVILEGIQRLRPGIAVKAVEITASKSEAPATRSDTPATQSH
jgi:membrane fusion protein (multidrug efflux system)